MRLTSGPNFRFFFGEELILGSFILRILPIFLIFIVMNNDLNTNKKNIYYATIISLACFVIYLSGERTSFGLLILYFITLFLFLHIYGNLLQL